MNLTELIAWLIAEGEFDRITQDPGAQFGLQPETYLGAGILPEQSINDDIVREQGMRYRSIIANDAARFSPVQLKQGAIQFGSMFAKMAESDVGKEYTGQDFENLRKLLVQGGNGEARLRFLGWLDREVNQSLLRNNEKHRWDALVNFSITRLGDNGYVETTAYTEPTGHNRQIAASWETKTAGVSDNDPFDDLFGLFEDARDKNVIFTRVIMSSATQFKLLRNTKVQDRAQFGQAGFVPPNDSIFRSPMAIPRLTSAFVNEGFPAPEVFDGTYEDDNGTMRYLPEGKILFIGQTGRAEQIDPVEGDTFYVANTLGYTGIGIPALRDVPGRVITTKVVDDDKPGMISCKGWQTSLPVILDPEKRYVLNSVFP